MDDEVFNIKSTDGRIMKVYDNRIILTQKGIMGFMSRGLSGDKTIFYSDVTSVQFKNCGWTAGYMEFTFAGSGDHTGGPISGSGNENRFTFGRPTIGAAKKLAVEMEQVNGFIQNKISGNKKAVNIQGVSTADELIKLKSLVDSGILTMEEFDAKKKQLLGL